MSETASRYPNVRPEYSTGSFSFGDPDPRLLDLIGDVSGKRVLDFACGDGPYTDALVKRGAKVVAADIDENALQTLSKTVNSSLAVPMVIDAFQGFPLQDGSVDMVVTTRFPNLFSQQEVTDLMREANRVLTPKGEVVFDFATHVKRTGTDGKKKTGATEVKHSIISGFRTVRAIMRDSGFETPKITLTRVNQDLRETAGYKMKNLKLNVKAKKKAV
jgi:cyclopropane fatty-acyl-phospholipid synthase-like methyltransferase